jgi:hypothetical protein
MKREQWIAVLLSSWLAVGAADAAPWGEEARLWRNVAHDSEDYDAEMAAIDEMVDPGEIAPHSRHIRALISRFDSITHYKAPDNLDLLVGAIANDTYPRYPAVDVLTRHGEVDEDRRAAFTAWSRALFAWSRGETSEAQLELNGRQVDIDQLLGERTRDKEWLSASLAKTLKRFTFTPRDHVAALDDQLFVRAVYQAALGRTPSPDDLAFRLGELRGGKTREAFVAEIYAAPEASQMRLYQVLESASCLQQER